MKLRRWISLLLALLASGCAISLRHPLPAADPALELYVPFLGTWSMVELGGQVPGEPIEVTVALDEAQDLIGELTAASSPLTQKFHLTQIGGHVFAFAENERSGVWNFAQLVLQDPQTVIVRGIDSQAVKQDIENGALAGEVLDVSAHHNYMRIEADSDELAAYIEANLTIFGGEAAILTKVE